MKKGFRVKKKSQKVKPKNKRMSELKQLFNAQKPKSLTVEEKAQKWKDYAYENLGRDLIVSYCYLSEEYWEYPERIVQRERAIFGEREGYKFFSEVYFDYLENGIIEHIAKQKGGENWTEIYRKLIRALNLAAFDIETIDQDDENYIEPDEVEACLSSFERRKIEEGLVTIEDLRNRYLIYGQETETDNLTNDLDWLDNDE